MESGALLCGGNLTWMTVLIWDLKICTPYSGESNHMICSKIGMGLCKNLNCCIGYITKQMGNGTLQCGGKFDSY